MPYQWTVPLAPNRGELHLWPHQSLSPEGFVTFILTTSFLTALPLLMLFGTALLWGLLPFSMLAVAGMWWALARSRRNAQIIEVLTLTWNDAHLLRYDPDGEIREWHCNRYWAHPELHEQGGPVPNYVTLRGAGREVEIGAFLSEGERKTLYRDLDNSLRRN